MKRHPAGVPPGFLKFQHDPRRTERIDRCLGIGEVKHLCIGIIGAVHLLESGICVKHCLFRLAAVIIGTTAFRRLDFVKGTTAAILGSVIYKICIQIAISLGLPANLMKLATAVLFLVILILGTQRRERARKGAAAHA